MFALCCNETRFILQSMSALLMAKKGLGWGKIGGGGGGNVEKLRLGLVAY